MLDKVKIIECPRDAIQSIKTFIPTQDKLTYYQSLINVGFDIIDIGSFVSKKVIPQLSDTAQILQSLELNNSLSKLLVIVANLRGAKLATRYHNISFIGYPFSISENFQMRNTNKTIEESEIELLKILNLASIHDKKVVVYLSMCFGNPYGDPWSPEIVDYWISKLDQLGVEIISFSDTIGTSTTRTISDIFNNSISKYPHIEFGAHLHTSPKSCFDKLNSAFNAGCRRFDGAIMGFGGCPMASDELVGNMPTEKIISYFTSSKVRNNIDSLRFESAYNKSLEIFNKYI